MIILEEIDGAGKTTVADYLNQNGYSTYHFTYDKKIKIYNEFKEKENGFKESSKRNISK